MNTLHGTELFTGNTMKLPAAIYEGKTNMAGLIKNWFWSYSGARMDTEQQHACCVREPQPVFACSQGERCCLLGVISHQAMLARCACVWRGMHAGVLSPGHLRSAPLLHPPFYSSTLLLLFYFSTQMTNALTHLLPCPIDRQVTLLAACCSLRPLLLPVCWPLAQSTPSRLPLPRLLCPGDRCALKA